MKSYAEFLATKAVVAPAAGFEPRPITAPLFDWQRQIVEWAVRRGRAALFEDCGLGKTPQQLEWARQVAQHTGRPVLILAPLAVAGQTVREGVKFGIAVEYAPTPERWSGCPIVITNYERLPAWRGEVGRFAGVVLDESSILKAFDGRLRGLITSAFSATPYRLACTATPAPNDHIELGTHAEFLGVMPRNEMMARWFINDLSSTTDPWRLKRHAVDSFWQWVTSWAACVGRPSDLGDFSDVGYDLPELRTPCSVVDVDLTHARGDALFRMSAMSATGIHAERRITATVRAERVAELVAAEPSEPWLVWCDTDYDAAELRARIPGAVEVRGSDKAEQKEDRLLGFVDGRIRVLITKPRIAGFGLNFQHCARTAFAGATYSFEQWYQAVRRCWRFGQMRSVDAHMICGATEVHVLNTLARKRREHERMKIEMFAAARREHRHETMRGSYNPVRRASVPSFMRRLS